MEQGGTRNGQAAGHGASSSAPDAQEPVAGTSGRSPGKVAFSDRNDEYKYRSSRRRDDDSSSESSTSSSSSSSSSSDSSDERSRRKHGAKGSSSSSSGGGGRRSGTSRERDQERDRRDSRRSEPPRDRREGSHHRGSEPAAVGSEHHTSSSSMYRVAGPAPGSYPPGLPPPHPYPPGLGPGMLGSTVTGAMPSPLLAPPPGAQFGPYSPAGTPTKAYTSPRSAQGPAPTLLMSQPPPVAYATSMAPPLQPQPPQPQPQQLVSPPPPAQLPPAAYPGTSALLDPFHALSLQAGAAQSQQHQPPPQQQLLQLPPVPHHALQPLGTSGGVLGPGGQPLNLLYDDTTQEVVYADDVMARELAKQGHALLPLGDAYRGKLAALQAAVNGQLLAKREALLQQHARLAARAGEVAAARAGMEREVAALAEDMLGKVRSAESLKQALLGREQAEVDGQLDAIGRLLGDVVSASAAGPVDFLNAYRRLADTCDRLAARPFKTEVDVAADDLPAEAGVYRQLAEAHGALSKLLAVKDQMIAHLLQERDAMQEELSQVVERYGSELAALEAQAEGYYRRLQVLGVVGAEAGGEETAAGSGAAANSRRGTQGG